MEDLFFKVAVIIAEAIEKVQSLLDAVNSECINANLNIKSYIHYEFFLDTEIRIWIEIARINVKLVLCDKNLNIQLIQVWRLIPTSPWNDLWTLKTKLIKKKVYFLDSGYTDEYWEFHGPSELWGERRRRKHTNLYRECGSRKVSFTTLIGLIWAWKKQSTPLTIGKLLKMCSPVFVDGDTK